MSVPIMLYVHEREHGCRKRGMLLNYFLFSNLPKDALVLHPVHVAFHALTLLEQLSEELPRLETNLFSSSIFAPLLAGRR